ncbi:MAG: methyltransferase domain-containing protein [Deltaproteobacteria bacterium]|nr:methyltransferase domain-containing protein [Deltaproteobacteria bacterium]
MNRLTRTALLLALAALVGGLFWWGLTRVAVTSDITRALPAGDPVVEAAREVLERHPGLDMVFVDLSPEPGRPAAAGLIAAAGQVEKSLAASPLVREAGVGAYALAFPALVGELVEKLPLLFSGPELAQLVPPRMREPALREHLAAGLAGLGDLAGVGRARFLTADPLGLLEPVLARFGAALPLAGANFVSGHLVSADGRHVLIPVRPAFSGRDTAAGVRLAGLLDGLATELAGRGVRLAYVGGFRAALDNERIIRTDTTRALAIITLGLVLLALVSLRRPWLGFLALLPAFGGLMLALFVYSLFRDSIMAMSLGFGGALVSVAVDHGLAAVLLLDQPVETHGREVARRLWRVASFPVYTTVAALLALLLSGVPVFQEVGLFAALGVGLAAVLVHLFLPLAFPRLGGAQRQPWLPLEAWLARLTARGSFPAAVALGVLALVLAWFIPPGFHADLQAMNTVTPATLAAEKTLERHWGGVFSRVYLVARAPNLAGLWSEANRLGDFLAQGQEQGRVAAGLPLLSLLPGPERQAANLAAWREFWTPARQAVLKENLARAGAGLGFTPDAFQGFLGQVADPGHPRLGLDPALLPALGVEREAKGGGWLLAGQVSPGPDYTGERFFARAAKLGFTVFDPALFSQHLAHFLANSFVRMLAVIGLAATGLVVLLFWDWRLVLIALAPLAFALVGALGLLGLSGRGLTLPTLMLAPVVLGMGLDYGLYLVRARQRSGPGEEMGPFRLTVVLGGVSTLVGMGALAFSRHAVLADAGTATFLGIGLALVGALILVPPLVERVLAPRELGPPPPGLVPGSPAHLRRAASLFRGLEPHPRLFALAKMRLDPMFPRLAELVRPGETVLDLGQGFGAPAAWLAALHPGLRFHGLEPAPERARVAARALGERAEVSVGAAPDLPGSWPRADVALVLDMGHYLDDRQFLDLLSRLARLLAPAGRLVLRLTVPGPGRPWFRRVETLRLALAGAKPHYRPAARVADLLQRAGFELTASEPSGPGREETWFLARVREGRA